MYGYRRARLDLDADTHETIRYFSLLRGVPVGGALRKVITLHAAQIEKEDPSIRAHMLAWRAAMDASRQNPVAAVMKDNRGASDLEDIPF